ncbi:hypothetical protein E5K75_00615 [Helicobacter pylori]|uniref:hypothetical protein n=1 Tax=Helicobacter pylori TaxID=210 RepID=UPI0013DE24D7|nr:hypothetical protein [Helicobacter pylori]WRD00043.1 hypothetical protein E5K75_00615 [Helicobacter pylori]
MEALALFLWGENLEKHARVFGGSGWFKKAVLSLLSYRVKISFKLALRMGD